jgi:hypothetical protein
MSSSRRPRHQVAAELGAYCPLQSATTGTAATSPRRAGAGSGVTASLRAGTAVVSAAVGLLVRVLGDDAAPHRPAVRGDRVDLVEERLDLSRVTNLVYELLDAHVDTVELALKLEDDPAWSAHLEYLRALNRQGREAVAHIGTMQPA